MIFHLFFTYTFIFPNESVSTAKFQPAKNLVVLADEFYKGKQYNFAIQYFEIAKQIDPSLGSQFNLLFKLGSSYKSAGSNLKAQECFAQLTGDSLLGDYALFELARLQNSSEPEKAMENYLQILRRYPVSVFTPEVCLAL